MLAPALRWLLAIAMLAMGACAMAAPAPPLAQGGELDLSAWRFDEQGAVSLDGEWSFVPRRLLGPDEPWPADAVTITVPLPWNKVLGHGHGTGTYRLRIACNSPAILALAIPFEHSAFTMFVNGEPRAVQGRPATRRDSYEPEVGNQFVTLESQRCPLELRVPIANFDLFRGGIVRSLQLGTAAQLAQRREAGLTRSALALGGISVVGLLSLVFAAWRRRDRTPLYFAFFCASFALSLGLSGERVLQPNLAWLGFEGHFRLLFLNWFMGIAIYPLLLQSLYPRQARPGVVRFVMGFCVAGAALSLAAPLPVFTYSTNLLLGIAGFVGLYLAWVLLQAVRQGERGAFIVLGGLAALGAAIVHDIVFYENVLSASALPYGLGAFVLAPALLLAQRFAEALHAQELRALEQGGRADLLVRATQAGVLDWDAISGVTRYSDRYREMLGLPAGTDAPEPPPFRTMLHPDDADMVHGSFMSQLRDRSQRGLRRGQPMDYRMTRADGGEIWVHAEAISVCDADGRTLRYICALIDVSEFHAQEAALRAQVELTRTEQRRLDLVVRAARVGIVDWDGFTHATWYSPRLREIRGYALDADTSVWPDYFKVLIHPDDRARIIRRWVPFIQGKGPEGPRGEYYAPEQYRMLRADGSYAWVEVSGMAVRDEQGFVTRWIAAIIDITERREQHEALTASLDQIAAQAALLERQNEALKENVRLREEVERIGRHDLKTPLNSIVAVPRLLREERKLGPEADELLGIVERAGYRILSMVNLSLDLYKMEQGTYVFRPDAVDFVDLARKVVADVRVHAASKQVHVALEANEAPYAWAEELLCYSLLANLLKNAVEASPEGGRVTVRIAGVPGGVETRIHNEGAVPEEIRGSFFQKYATLGKASGTGLGTYSANLMARVQDGEVSMSTSEAGGTTLVVRMRQAPAGKMPALLRHVTERRPVAPEALASMPPVRVLLVDDDEFNLLIVRRFLPSPPFTVETAINGRLALAHAERQWPDLVFMDLDMPVMGGLETVMRMRELEVARAGARCRIVALSSHDDAQTKQRALEAGFDEYLTKPVTRDAIQQMLVHLHRGLEQVVVVDADMKPVLPGFVASRKGLLVQLARALEAADRRELRRLAHQLAGSFALYGFRWAAERCRSLETHSAEIPLVEAAALVDELQRHLDTVDIRFEEAGA